MTNPLALTSLLSQKAQFGFYFHIPFCPHICPYCDFVKTSSFSAGDVRSYFEGLSTQLDYFLSAAKECGTHCTVYFGGGTPSLFPARYYAPLLEKIKQHFVIDECTIESNPFTNSEKALRDFAEVGFSRLTLGAQSLDDNVLKTLGRKHIAKDVLHTLEDAINAEFTDIQVDLIYGLKKGIRRGPIENEVDTLCDNGASGISAYALTLEARTTFAHSGFADEDSAADEYLRILQQCQHHNLTQRETSNFSRNEALHNNIYWYGGCYFGIGTGAHGLLPCSEKAPFGQRYKIAKQLQERAPGDDIIAVKKDFEKIFEIVCEAPRTKTEYRDEMIFTLLRTPHGLPWDWLEKWAPGARSNLLADPVVARGLTENKLIATNKALHVAPTEKIRGDAWCLKICAEVNEAEQNAL